MIAEQLYYQTLMTGARVLMAARAAGIPDWIAGYAAVCAAGTELQLNLVMIQALRWGMR